MLRTTVLQYCQAYYFVANTDGLPRPNLEGSFSTIWVEDWIAEGKMQAITSNTGFLLYLICNFLKYCYVFYQEIVGSWLGKSEIRSL